MECMKITIAFIIAFTSSLSFACSDLDTSKKPTYLSASKVDCGTLLHSIHEPTMTVNGRKYAFGMRLGDLSGECPDPKRGCYTPYYNIKRRGNAICRAYGFGPYAKMRDFGAFRRKPNMMVSLERNSRGRFAPKVISINHSRSEYSWAKTIYCHRSYRKR